MQVIREALESLLEASVASTVLLEALGHLPDDQDLPTDARALLEFAEGPLRQTLQHHVGGSQTDLTLDSLNHILGTALRAVAAGQPEQAKEASGAKTQALPDNVGPTRLLVVARSERMLNRIKAAVGAHRLAAAASSDIGRTATLRQALSPDIIVVDGQDAPNIDPLDLAADLTNCGEHQVVVIWANDQPWGNAVSGALKRQGCEFAACPRSAGMEPLVDYVRSRFS